jgi:putative ABC transport system substrate-binding protein
MLAVQLVCLSNRLPYMDGSLICDAIINGFVHLSTATRRSRVVKKFLLLTLLAFLSLARPVTAGDLLVVQSLSIKPYDDALKGIRSVCTGKVVRVDSAGLSEADFARKVRKTRPDLIFAIGSDALAKVRAIRDVPIVYLMVLNPEVDESNITGVSLNIAPERQLSLVRQVLPHVKKVGLLFDPAKSSSFVNKAHGAASMLGFELLAKGVDHSRDAVTSLDGMKGKIQALWLFPDTSVVNAGTIDLLLLAAIENRVPVFTFSDKYVEKGALLSLEVNALEVGKQAGEMANRILAGTAVKNIEKADARGGNVTVNLIVAKKLGISINGDLLKHARVIR